MMSVPVPIGKTYRAPAQFLFLMIVILFVQPWMIHGQVLRKRYYNGVAFAPIPDSVLKKNHLKQGLAVNRVVPGGTGMSAGLQAGDIVLAINKVPLTAIADLRGTSFAHIRVGDTVTYKVYRSSSVIYLSSVATGRPDEKNNGIEYSYESIPFKKGLLRAIISKPTNVAQKLPTILFIQGYPCSEIVDIDTANPYRRITDGLTRAGYVVMRVEKPGVGDCLNTPNCGDIDFETECEAFETALLHLKKRPQVDTANILLWGHSLGGVVTPILTAKYSWIKGAVVYGTLSKIWGEYILQMTRVQSEGFGVPPIEVEANVRAVRKILYEIYVLKKSPTQFIKENPHLRETLQSQFMWEQGSDRLFTRSAKFNQTLDAVNVNHLWSQTSCKVLVMYGEADIEALSADNALSIVKTVNHYHPGNGTYQFVKGTDHAFAKVGSIEDGYRTKADPQYSRIMIENFNPEVITLSESWIRNVVQGKASAQAEKPQTKSQVQQQESTQGQTTTQHSTTRWNKLNTEPYRGKQDDIYFIDEYKGWYVNGGGNIYTTSNGGQTWEKCFSKPGTFFRCIAFIDSLHGFVGNVGTDYFPNVQDTIPLYKTVDGGKTWTPVAYSGPYVKGLCAIDIVKEQYINHGQIDYKYHIYGVGRVGSPANIIVSNDGGTTFSSWSMDNDCKMLFDIKMFNKNEGFACAATNTDIPQSHALILYTKDGGKTWEKRYQSNRPFETTWKVSFPTPDIGYVTIQNYNPDKAVSKQRVAKTIDGGKTWFELDLCDDHNSREFGIGFIDALHGFVGTTNTGYETTDGGKTWTKAELGRACNKIRIYTTPDGKTYGYAIGVDVLKLSR